MVFGYGGTFLDKPTKEFIIVPKLMPPFKPSCIAQAEAWLLKIFTNNNVP